jgi:hypothetical protein
MSGCYAADHVGYVSPEGVRWAERQILRHPRLGHAVCRVLSVLGQFANRDGQSWPSSETLAYRLRAGVRTVNLHLAEIERLGIIRTRFSRRGARMVERSFELLNWGLSQLKVEEPSRREGLRAPPGRSEKATLGGGPGTSRGIPDSPPGESQIPRPGESQIPHNRSRYRSSTRGEEQPRAAERPDPSPPPAAPAPSPVVGEQGPAEVTTLAPGPMVEVYNVAADASGLVLHAVPLDRRLAVALVQAAKHPAIGRDIRRWRSYLRWVTKQPWLNGERSGSYPADLLQVTAGRLIARWAGERAAEQRPRPPAPEGQVFDPNDPYLIGIRRIDAGEDREVVIRDVEAMIAERAGRVGDD